MSAVRECWPDGKLRAFLDRELPAEELTRLAAHLEQCPECGRRSRELSSRAARVLDLVGGLATAAEPVAWLASKPVVRTPRRDVRWKTAVGIAAALAAGWAALALLSPKPVQAPVATHFEAAPLVESPHVADAPMRPEPALVRVRPRHIRPAFPSAGPHATLAGFVALDDDPIDAGIVLRVALADGRMQADVLYSPDGRPRAIRLVNDAIGK